MLVGDPRHHIYKNITIGKCSVLHLRIVASNYPAQQHVLRIYITIIYDDLCPLFIVKMFVWAPPKHYPTVVGVLYALELKTAVKGLDLSLTSVVAQVFRL